MPELKKILIAEDELTNSLLLKRLLAKAGYHITVARNGADAFELMNHETYDMLLTDWMMPFMDGIELIRRVRESDKPAPLIIMVTALVSESAKKHALDSGADDFISKPIDVDELLSRVADGLLRKEQSDNTDSTPIEIPEQPLSNVSPPFAAVVFATSTGGPPTLIQIFKDINPELNAAYYIVQHGPSWMLETFAQRLQQETAFKVVSAQDGMESKPGQVYVAPGDKHMRINPSDFTISLDDGAKENFVRPAADPLFRSAAAVFGSNTIAVVLTGLGRDGAQGLVQVAAAGGRVVVQDPETTVAPSMPRAAIETGAENSLVNLSDLGDVIANNISKINAKILAMSI